MDGYVYYKWLEKASEKPHNTNGYYDEYIKESTKVLENLSRLYNIHDNSNVADSLMGQAHAEVSKEVQALQTLFGVPISATFSLDDLGATEAFFKEVIDALNKTLNLKENFERNVSRIKSNLKDTNEEGKLQINIASFFDTYYAAAWSDRQAIREGKMLNSIASAIESGVPEDEAIDQYFTIELEETIKLAIKKMLLSDRFNGKDEDTEKDYQKLYDILDTFQGTGLLIQQLKQAYQIDTIKEEMRRNISVSSKQKKVKYKDLEKANVKSMVSKQRYGRGGQALEFFENFITNSLLSGTIKNDGIEISITGQSTHTGASGMKADNIITFGINQSYLDDMLKSLEGKQVNRTNITSAIQDMENKLKNVKEGFIIYSSAKNYVRKDKGFEGFSGGAAIKMDVYQAVSGKTEVVEAIKQLLPGAVGDTSENRENVNSAIAQHIAYLLFDDFTIDGSVKDGPTSLHLFDLDGIYIPLSFLLFRMAKAIKETQKNPTSVISIEIKNKNEILFPEESNYSGGLAGYWAALGGRNSGPHGKYNKLWTRQANEANNIEVEVHFLKDFFSFIQQNF